MPTGGPDSGESLEGSLRRLNQTAPDFPADAKPQATRPGGKMGLVLDMVSHANGATIDELATQAGWLTHTTRAAPGAEPHSSSRPWATAEPATRVGARCVGTDRVGFNQH